MARMTKSVVFLPAQAADALRRLGADLALARVRRKESLKSWAKRIGVSVPTVMRMEAGEPSVSIAVYGSALWLVGRHAALAELASPQNDLGALESEVTAAIKTGRSRSRAARAAAEARKAKN